MRFIPSPRLFWIACAPAVLAVGALVWVPLSLLFPVVIFAALAGSAWDFRILKRTRGALSAQLVLPGTAVRGRAFEMQLNISSSCDRGVCGVVRMGLPSNVEPSLWLKSFRVESLGSIQLKDALRPLGRGLHAFGSLWLRIPGPLGLITAQWEIPTRGQVKVFPDLTAVREMLIQARARENAAPKVLRHTFRGVGTEFESLSDYREGDDPRHIEWRATARHARLITRRFEVERNRDVLIVLDCGRLMGAETPTGTKLDAAVDSALMLGSVALSSGDRCGVTVFSNRVHAYLPPRSGHGAFDYLLEGIYDVSSQWTESYFGQAFTEIRSRQRKRALVVILSDLVDPETSEGFCAALARLARQHVVLFAALRTPSLSRLTTSPVGNAQDAHRKAVAFSYLGHRSAALHRARRFGVHILDVEPSDLTVPLVNHYVDLRERNLL